MAFTADGDRDELSTRDVVVGVARVVLGLGALVGVVGVLGWAYRAELERFGAWFVEHFGLPGMAAGSFLADGLHFPLPPQFYLLTGIAGGVGTIEALGSVLAGSVLGGLLAFAVARRLSGVPLLARWFTTTQRLIEKLMNNRGRWGLVIAGMLPISYFVLCTLGGLMRLRYRDYGVLAIMRVPRIVLSYLLIVLAWRW